jgi:hypothetical protein
MRYFKFLHTHTVRGCLLRACVVSLLLTISIVASPAAEVRLAWDRSAEESVAGYRVYYGTASRSYTQSVDAGAETTVTVYELQDGARFYFAAVAYNQARQESPYSDEVSWPTSAPQQSQESSYSITLQLQAGWNLISLPVQPANTATATVIQPVAPCVTQVLTTINGVSTWYDPTRREQSTLSSMIPGIGYWMQMSCAGTLTIAGSTASKSVNLVAGMNMVGYSSLFASPISTALASIAGKYASVWSYENGAWKTYYPNDPAKSQFTQLTPGKGYWIQATTTTTWTLP